MPSPVTFLTDFPDRISPMLVKELRQGLRAKTFITVFLSLQIFLAVMLFSAGAASTSDYVGSIVSGIIFTFFAVAVLLVQPLRGTNALSSEVKGNTIDMMVLTRLSAWRIVFGKWVAIVSQSGLLLATIIPYLILRYFFGGMNLVGELVFLILLFLTSMALTAVTVGLSGCNSVIVRSLVPILGLPALLIMLMAASVPRAFRGGFSIMDFCSLDSTDARIVVACYVAAMAYVGGSMLSLGASLIAPAAENHSIARRLVAAILVTLLLAFEFFKLIEDYQVLIMIFVVVVPAMIISLTESAPLVASVCKPFVKRGIVGKVVGWMFYPTWESGIWFGIFIGLLSINAFFNPLITQAGHPGAYSRMDMEESIYILSIFGGLLFPAAWQVFFFRGDGQRVANYLLLLVGSFVMLGVLAILAESMNSRAFLWFFAWNPLAFIAMIGRHGDKELLLGGVALVDIGITGILAVRALMEMRKSILAVHEAEHTEAKS